MNKIATLAIALMASLTLGFDHCSIEEIPIGEESETISQAWDYEPKNLKEHVQRLEMIVQLQRREHVRILQERAWFHDCMDVLMDPAQSPQTSQFNVYASMVDWCKVNFGD